MSLAVTNFHREVSLRLLKGMDALVVRTPRGQKDPGHLGWDPKANSQDKSKQALFALEKNDDNLGIHLCGDTVDVDIDADNPVLLAALDYFLPHTDHVWGRPSRPRTHRLYTIAAGGLAGDAPFDPTLYNFLKKIAGNDQLSVEIRGGEQKSGQYSLLPGSLHPSGEYYEWEDAQRARSTSPVAVPVTRVVGAVRLACAAAVVAPYWTEGNRNNLCMALSGFMHRAAIHSRDAEASPLPFDKTDAEALLKGVMEIADEDPSDIQMRLRTFEQTWEKGDNGDPVAGATKLVELTGDPGIKAILYTLLIDSPEYVALDEFFERFAYRNNTSDVIDLRKVGSKAAVFMMSVQDFRNSYAHKSIITPLGARKQMTNIWLNSDQRTLVDGMCFRPGKERQLLVEEHGNLYVNQWSGFAVEPYEGEATDADVAPFLDYVWRILAKESEHEVRDWVLDWVAHIFQHPKTVPGTALVLVAKPGSGKSFLGDRFIRRIIGGAHTMQTNTIDSLTGQFNSDSAAMLFIQCDEALTSNNRSAANRLKSMITDPTRRVEPKGVNAYQIENCARYLFTSNEEREAVAITDGRDDRRYTVIKVNEDFAYKSPMPMLQKRRYWDDLIEWTEDETNLAKVHKWLLQRPINLRAIRAPLETAARDFIMQHSQRGIDGWLMQIINYPHPYENLRGKEDMLDDSQYIDRDGKFRPSLRRWPDFVAYMRLEQSYTQYRREKGMSSSIQMLNAQQIIQELKARGLLPEKPRKVRVRASNKEDESGRRWLTEFPSVAKIQKYLEDKLGFESGDETGEDINDGQPDF